MSRRQDYEVRVARRLLAAYERGPRWLRHLVPDGAYVALLKPMHAADDREAAAVYRASCERARKAELAQREAMGPGCYYCPNEELTSYDDDGDRYKECPVCGATWPIGPSPDDDNPYDELRPLRSATTGEEPT
uniref:hypothetical protein n=1 Tax=Promicromonospora sp. CA-289581 TaxID=3240013 RepID=UPI003F4946BA